MSKFFIILDIDLRWDRIWQKQVMKSTKIRLESLGSG